MTSNERRISNHLTKSGTRYYRKKWNYPKHAYSYHRAFKTNKLLKIKILKDIAHTYGVDYFLEYLIQQLGIYVLDVRGFTAVISKRAVHGVQIPKKYRIMRKQHVKQEKLDSNHDKEPKNEEKAYKSDENNDNDEPEEPEFIDYDDEELLAQIDAASDEIYGNASIDTSAQPKSPLISQIKPEKVQHVIKKSYKNLLQNLLQNSLKNPLEKGKIKIDLIIKIHFERICENLVTIVPNDLNHVQKRIPFK